MVDRPRQVRGPALDRQRLEEGCRQLADRADQPAGRRREFGQRRLAVQWRPARDQALHWNGSSWSPRTIPSWVITKGVAGTYSATVADFGPSDLWVFGAASGRYAARYNGHKWTKTYAPAGLTMSEVSAVSRNDIWALGLKSTGQRVVMHWTGKAWHTRCGTHGDAREGRN
jgi:hypothetical protein